MHKLVLLLSFIGVSILLVFGLLWPDNPAVWLASTSHEFAAIRIILLGAFAMLLVTAPPRNVLMRQGLGMLAFIIGLWTLGQTYENQMKLLDSLVLLEFSICTGISVLENAGREFLQTSSSKKAMLTGTKSKKTAIA